MSGATAASIIPPAKTLSDRVTQPKAQPKSAAADKKKDAASRLTASGARGGRKRSRGGRSARPTKKSAEELDSEMADYFEAGNQNENTDGAAPAATNGDAPMDDEILVRLSLHRRSAAATNTACSERSAGTRHQRILHGL